MKDFLASQAVPMFSIHSLAIGYYRFADRTKKRDSCRNIVIVVNWTIVYIEITFSYKFLFL